MRRYTTRAELTAAAFMGLLGFLVAPGRPAKAGGDVPAAAKPADADLVSWVDRRVAEWQPGADEKRFDEIGWSTSILEAERLARESRRPIFHFSHDGRMNVGRC